jgi:pimeloyl-ACP methyl ester carboxylesterase
MQATAEEIVYTGTEDGFLLEGLHIRPTGQITAPRAAIVWIHGNAARFYDYPYVSIGRALAGAGFAVLCANTRGHDISAFLWRAAGQERRPRPWESPQDMPIGGGSAWDTLEEAPRDLAAWVDLASSDLATDSVVLVGHSSGAQRVILYQVERQDPRVAGVVLASPDLVGFMPAGQLAEAERMIAEGRGMEVLPAAPFAPWYRQSAQNVAGRSRVLAHMLESSNDQPATISEVNCRVLAFYGTKEVSAQNMLQTIQARATGAASVDTRLIEGADHIYSGQEEQVARVIAEWVGDRIAGPS